jgi:hypothetical protein
MLAGTFINPGFITIASWALAVGHELVARITKSAKSTPKLQTTAITSIFEGFVFNTVRRFDGWLRWSHNLYPASNDEPRTHDEIQ